MHRVLNSVVSEKPERMVPELVLGMWKKMDLCQLGWWGQT